MFLLGKIHTVLCTMFYILLTNQRKHEILQRDVSSCRQELISSLHCGIVDILMREITGVFDIKVYHHTYTPSTHCL